MRHYRHATIATKALNHGNRSPETQTFHACLSFIKLQVNWIHIRHLHCLIKKEWLFFHKRIVSISNGPCCWLAAPEEPETSRKPFCLCFPPLHPPHSLPMFVIQLRPLATRSEHRHCFFVKMPTTLYPRDSSFVFYHEAWFSGERAKRVPDWLSQGRSWVASSLNRR